MIEKSGQNLVDSRWSSENMSNSHTGLLQWPASCFAYLLRSNVKTQSYQVNKYI
jgi:hypothetical protein